ncbi:hypothetical protein D9M69_662930 [compost metagenome]
MDRKFIRRLVSPLKRALGDDFVDVPRLGEQQPALLRPPTADSDAGVGSQADVAEYILRQAGMSDDSAGLGEQLSCRCVERHQPSRTVVRNCARSSVLSG